MQYKKKEISEKILDAGREEYATKGFRAGNISSIAEKAGVPVGNLYRYYDGKTGLLDAIVKPAYLETPKLLQQLQTIQILDAKTLELSMPMLINQLLVFFDSYGKELLILVDNCATTRYEDFYNEIVLLVADITVKKLYESPTDSDIFMGKVIAKTFLNALFDMLRMELTHDEIKPLVFKLIKFFFYEVDSRK